MDTLTDKPVWQNFIDRRALIMLFLGFSAGIPILLIFSSLSLWLREAGIDRSTVTMFSWAALGYSFKFIWAPLIDALPVPIIGNLLGRRRAWMLVAQLGVIAAILTIASVDPTSHSVLKIMAVGAVLLGFSSATQDIVIDAYRIELAPPAMQSILSAMYTTGYRIGMIIAGAGALYLADFFGSTETTYSYIAWRNTYWVMAGVMLVGVATTLIIHEPENKNIKIRRQASDYIGLLAVFIFSITAFIYGFIYTNSYLPEDLTYPEIIFANGTKLISVICYGVIIYFLVNFIKKNIEQSTYIITCIFAIFSVIFVALFKYSNHLTLDSKNPLIKFAAEVSHLATTISLAFILGYILVQIGLVNKDFAKSIWVEPIFDFFKRYGKKALLLLALIGLYRISDIVAGVISNVFYKDMGFSKTDIATAVKVIGVWVTIAGSFIGGILAQHIRLMHVMMLGAILASITNLFFVLLTYNPANLTFMYIAVVADNLAAGLASAAFIAFLSALTSIRFTAVQYAIFSSLMSLLPKVLGGYSGTIVDNTSYQFFFVFCCLIGLPVLLLVYLVDKQTILEDKSHK